MLWVCTTFWSHQIHSRCVHTFRWVCESLQCLLLAHDLAPKEATVKNFRRATALGLFVSAVRAMDALLLAVKKLPRSEEGLWLHFYVDHLEIANEPTLITLARKYSLGFVAFISSVVALLIDGELPKSSLLTIWYPAFPTLC